MKSRSTRSCGRSAASFGIVVLNRRPRTASGPPAGEPAIPVRSMPPVVCAAASVSSSARPPWSPHRLRNGGESQPKSCGCRPRQVFLRRTCRGGSLPAKVSLREGYRGLWPRFGCRAVTRWIALGPRPCPAPRLPCTIDESASAHLSLTERLSASRPAGHGRRTPRPRDRQ